VDNLSSYYVFYREFTREFSSFDNPAFRSPIELVEYLVSLADDSGEELYFSAQSPAEAAEHYVYTLDLCTGESATVLVEYRGERWTYRASIGARGHILLEAAQ